jgi:heme A synthase
MHVPLSIALMHQACAVLVLAVAVAHLYAARNAACTSA